MVNCFGLVLSVRVTLLVIVLTYVRFDSSSPRQEKCRRETVNVISVIVGFVWRFWGSR